MTIRSFGGGSTNTASGNFSFVGVGVLNSATVATSGVVAGGSNTAGGIDSFIGAGVGNSVTGERGSILGGAANTVTGVDAVVVGGGDTAGPGTCAWIADVELVAC